MAKKKKEKVAEEAPKVNEPKGDVAEVQMKMKKKPEVVDEQTITKVDLNKPITPKENEEIKEDTINDGGVVELVEDANTSQEQEKIQQETETQETSILEEITNEEKVEEIEEIATNAIVEAEETGRELPENIQKLMNFMEDTGGDLNDYVTLNQDYAELDNHTLLKEYYKQTKPHLSDEEVDFVMEDEFAYDEDIDEDRQIKRKKLAMKEQVAQARLHLESVKSKYYEDIKMGSKLTSEQQNAIEGFDKYNRESELDKKIFEEQQGIFERETNKVFNEKFKGFEYEVGDKRFRFNVNDVNNVKETQSDINNFIKRFLNEDMRMENAKGYHKSLYTAMNADKIANHFYEQGKADAIKNSIAKSKNVDMSPRQTFGDDVNANGIRVRALDTDASSDFKFKIKKKN
jgi:hypothetical protein